MRHTVHTILAIAILALAGCGTGIGGTSLSEARDCFEEYDGAIEDAQWDALVSLYRSMRETDWSTKEDAYYFLLGICDDAECTTCGRKLIDAVW